MNAERFKSALIATHEPLKTLALLCGVTFLVVATWAAIRYTANDSRRQAVYDDIGEAAKNLKTLTANLGEGVAEVKPTLQRTQALEAELSGLTSDLRGHTATLMRGVDGRLQTVDTLLRGLTGVSDEASRQVKANGDASAVLLASLNRTITDVDTRFSKLLDDGSLMLETANPKLLALLEHADAVVVTADGTIAAYKPVAEHLNGVAVNAEAMTADSRQKLHEVLWPPKVQGFWPNIRRTASWLLTPAMDGARIYFQLHSLPVRIIQPIPMLRPQ